MWTPKVTVILRKETNSLLHWSVSKSLHLTVKKKSCSHWHACQVAVKHVGCKCRLGSTVYVNSTNLALVFYTAISIFSPSLPFLTCSTVQSHYTSSISSVLHSQRNSRKPPKLYIKTKQQTNKKTEMQRHLDPTKSKK